MAYRIELSDTAASEVDSTISYLATQTIQGANRWYLGLLDRIRTLEQNPQRCPLSFEAERAGHEVRELLYGKRQHKYRILFTISGDVVTIRNVRHAARRMLDE